ncbi:hypothetical protein V5O48_002657 [Marasmius crinis-equi]|uniref:RRM domain-containing protein n=1 Tax=Marasmius crinis-equi TaxID=585013 RepID=A0ABR3FW24_9AGAR
MASLRGLHVPARQFLFPSTSSRFPTLSARLFATESTISASPSRTVILHGISSSDALSELIDQHPVGSIDHIKYDPEKKRAFINYFGKAPALSFLGRIKSSTTELDAKLFHGEPIPPSTEVIAAVGLRGASRCIIINPAPRDATKESLAKVLTRYGQVEKVEIQPNSGGEKSFARVHFYSIHSALKAVRNIRKDEDMHGLGIHFTPDRSDAFLQERLHDARRPAAENVSGNLPNAVRLSDVKTAIGWKRLEWVVKNATSSDRPVLSSLKKAPQGSDIYLNFFYPRDAALFVQAFNSQVPRPLRGCGTATLVPRKHVEVSNYYLSRAASLGASRTIAISKIKDWTQITHARIFRDFAKFGHIIEIRVNEYGSLSLSELPHVMDAMTALDRIQANPDEFSRYVGTHIAFTSQKRLVPIIPKSPTDNAKAEDAHPPLPVDAASNLEAVA